ncbi:MAG TPA: pentapeptide repeat-containing protein [Verrucomicrobiales bacterium]|nr:pentapeptide repeat-containing protein [Verrucomicrobiales bacterium]
MLKRLKAHEGELDPDMYRASRKRHMDQLGEAISEMTPKEQDEYLAGLGNFFHEMGITSQRQGEGDGLDLSGHNLLDGDWTNTDFKSMGVDPDQGFREANFGGSDLSRGNFRGVDLRGADFTGARLIDADFTGADLRGANFDGADLAGVNFTGANIEGVIWGNSTPDDNTIWPDDGYPGFDSDPPLTGGVPRGPNSAGRGGPLRDRRGRFIDRVFDPDADYTFEDLEKWPMLELREVALSLDVSTVTDFRRKTKKKLIEDILTRNTERPPRQRHIGIPGARNKEPSQAQKLDMLRSEYRNAETVGDQDEMDRIADELRGLGGKPFTRRRRPDRGRRIDREDPPLTGTVPSPFDRRGVERSSADAAMERYDALGLEELDLEVATRSYSAQRLRDLKAAREVLFEIEEDPTLPRGLRDQARGDIRALRFAIDAEEAIRARGLQEAWNVQYADSSSELLKRGEDALTSGRIEDLDANWENDVEEAIAAWTGPGPTPLLGGGYTQSGPDDRPGGLRNLQSFRDNLQQFKSAAGAYEGVAPRAMEIIADLEIFPEDEGYVADEDLGGLIGELEEIEGTLSDVPYVGMEGPFGMLLQDKRDMLLTRVRSVVREALHREQELELGPLGAVEKWTGDDLDGSTALLSTGIRSRPAGLGIAGDVVDGFVRGKRVPIGHKGIKTRLQAAEHVRSGGDISDVPDEYLTHALLTNSSRYPGERFLRMFGLGSKTDIYILRQRINRSAGETGEPDVYGQEGFVIKGSTDSNEISPLIEWAAAEVLHNLGFPMLPYRMSGPDLMNTRGESARPDSDDTIPSGRGATVVMEFAWNGHPIGELLSPDHSTDGFDVSDFGAVPKSPTESPEYEVALVGLEGRLMNFLSRMLLSDLDGHPGNAISAHAPDGSAGVVPIDLEGGLDSGNAVSLYGSDDLATYFARVFHDRTVTTGLGGFYMDRDWRKVLLQAIEDNPEVEHRFDTIIRTAIERFKMMLGDPNWVERLASAGPYSDLVRKRSLEELHTNVVAYAATMLPKLENVDGIVDALLGRIEGEDIVDTDPSVKEFDPSSDKMLAVMDYINTCLESAA